jgi:hypothetical protein
MKFSNAVNFEIHSLIALEARSDPGGFWKISWKIYFNLSNQQSNNKPPPFDRHTKHVSLSLSFLRWAPKKLNET